MNKRHVPSLLAFAVLVLAAGLLWSGRPALSAAPSGAGAPGTLAAAEHVGAGDTETAIEAFASIPATFGLWTGIPLEVEAAAVELLETDDVTLMEYRLGASTEPPVWLVQVAGFGTRAAFHPPELCYVGSHFEILERAPITVLANGREHQLMRLVVGQGGEQFESWYWFTANERVTHNYYQQQLWLVMGTIRHEPSSGTLVRISTALDEPTAARRRLLAFLTSFTSGA